VHFLLGKLYKKAGNSGAAMGHFLKALDLDPKDSNLVKAEMDKLDVSLKPDALDGSF
jgi:hypothetical protein